MHIGVVQCITRTLGIEQEVILITEEAMDIIHEVIKYADITTIITEKMVTEVKVIIEREVVH